MLASLLSLLLPCQRTRKKSREGQLLVSHLYTHTRLRCRKQRCSDRPCLPSSPCHYLLPFTPSFLAHLCYSYIIGSLVNLYPDTQQKTNTLCRLSTFVYEWEKGSLLPLVAFGWNPPTHTVTAVLNNCQLRTRAFHSPASGGSHETTTKHQNEVLTPHFLHTQHNSKMNALSEALFWL